MLVLSLRLAPKSALCSVPHLSLSVPASGSQLWLTMQQLSDCWILGAACSSEPCCFLLASQTLLALGTPPEHTCMFLSSGIHRQYPGETFPCLFWGIGLPQTSSFLYTLLLITSAAKGSGNHILILLMFESTQISIRQIGPYATKGLRFT